MDINIYSDKMHHAELFGKPVLTTDCRIPRETVPDGWFCYDMQGTRRDPSAHATLVDYADFDHSGTILSPVALKRPATKSRRINGGDFLCDEGMDLQGFCEEYNLSYPENPIKFELRPASPDEAGIFYALPPDEDERLGAIGHVRIDFGYQGQEFWHTWWPRGPEELNSPEFRDELDQVMNQLRQNVLKDLTSMKRWCYSHSGEISSGWTPNFGYVVETDRYRYCLRCNPVEGDYQAYLTAFDLQVQEMNQVQEQQSNPGQAQGPELGGMSL